MFGYQKILHVATHHINAIITTAANSKNKFIYKSL